MNFEQSIGLPVLAGEDEVTCQARQLLDTSARTLEKMTSLECGYAAYTMRQFAFRLQRAINREQGKHTLLEEGLKKAIARRVTEYRGVSFEERRLQAVRAEKGLSELEDTRIRTRIRLDRIAFLANKADRLADSLEAIAYSKRGQPND